MAWTSPSTGRRSSSIRRRRSAPSSTASRLCEAPGVESPFESSAFFGPPLLELREVHLPAGPLLNELQSLVARRSRDFGRLQDLEDDDEPRRGLEIEDG